MGFIVYLIASMVMFGVLLPLMAMLYFDILQVREETKQQQKTVQKLIEKSKEEK
jgi:cell division protein FtsB